MKHLQGRVQQMVQEFENPTVLNRNDASVTNFHNASGVQNEMDSVPSIRCFKTISSVYAFYFI